jgi:hypothetical protein
LIAHAPGVIARRWPACLLFALTGALAAGYRQGSSWRVWWSACGRRTPAEETLAAWESAFRASLATFGLAAFADVPVDRALVLHTGVPDACLEDFCSALGVNRGTPPDGPAVWISGRPETAGFIARCDKVMTAIAEGLPADVEGVPARFIDAMTRFGRAPRERATALMLDAFGLGPLVRMDDGSTRQASVADIGDGLGVFDADGGTVPDLEPVPTAVWLLFPRDSPPLTDGGWRVVTRGLLPPRWSGWDLVEADLVDVRWLQASTPDAPRRVVRGLTKPVLLGGAVLDALFAPDGRPVYCEPPALRFPARAADWISEIRGAGDAILARRLVSIAGEAPPDTAEIWDDVPRPLLGEYTVRVTGPAGFGLVRTVVLTEGLKIEAYPAVRLLRPEGLEPAEAVLLAPPGMTAIPSALTFDQATAAKPVEVLTRHRRAVLTLAPPRMRVVVEDMLQDGDGLRPLRIDVDSLSRLGRMRLEVPGATRAPTLVLQADGVTVQTVEPHRDGGYNLRRLLDTAASASDTVLTFTHDDRTATVALLASAEPSEDPWLPQWSRTDGNDQRRAAPEGTFLGSSGDQ